MIRDILAQFQQTSAAHHDTDGYLSHIKWVLGTAAATTVSLTHVDIWVRIIASLIAIVVGGVTIWKLALDIKIRKEILKRPPNPTIDEKAD